MHFEPDEIKSASAICKRAASGMVGAPMRRLQGLATPLPVSNPHAYNTMADYQNWFHPPSMLDEPPPRRPGIFSSLGKSTLGTLGRTPIPWYNRGQGLHMAEPALGDAVRSFVGLSPGRSGLRNIGSGLLDTAGDVLTGNWSGAGSDLRNTFTKGLAAPYQRARLQSGRYQTALSDWLTGTDAGLSPARYFRRPGMYPGLMPVETTQKLLHPIWALKQPHPEIY